MYDDKIYATQSWNTPVELPATMVKKNVRSAMASRRIKANDAISPVVRCFKLP